MSDRKFKRDRTSDREFSQRVDEGDPVLLPHDATPGVYLLISIAVAPSGRDPYQDEETPPAAASAVQTMLEEAGYRCVSGLVQWAEVFAPAFRDPRLPRGAAQA